MTMNSATEIENPTPSAFLTWGKNCEASQVLKQMLAAGKIPDSMQPKEAYKLHPLFKSYRLESFRGAFNRLKKELTMQHTPRPVAQYNVASAGNCK